MKKTHGYKGEGTDRNGYEVQKTLCGLTIDNPATMWNLTTKFDIKFAEVYNLPAPVITCKRCGPSLDKVAV